MAVLGYGIDVIYPPEHAGLADQISRSGAVMSEYPLGTRPNSHHFPRRNRLLSGLSLGTLVVEAGEGSGALWTVRHALEQGREVFCVPGNIYSPASKVTNQLIQESAKLVTVVEDILEELNLSALAGEQPPLPGLALPEGPEEAALLGILEFDPQHVDDLSRRSGLPIRVVTSTLALLEVKGLTRLAGRMHYVKVREAAAPYASRG